MTHRSLSKRLKAWRKRQKFSQSQAATHLGASVATYRNWEHARRLPRGVTLTFLVNATE